MGNLSEEFARELAAAILAGDGLSINVTLVGASSDALGPAAHVGSGALEKSHVASAVPCTLRSAKALNNSGSDLWLFVLDAAALPGDGATPSRIPIPVPSGQVNGDTWQGGTALATGCVLALSSTLATLTLVATTDGWFDVEIG